MSLSIPQGTVLSPQMLRAGPGPSDPQGRAWRRYSLNLVGQAAVDVFIPHTLLLGGEGPGGARMV